MADYVVRLSGQDNLSSTINKVKTELNDLGSKGQTATEKIDAKFNKIINSTAPLKRQLRDLQQLMAQMNFNGMSNTEQFTQVAQAAGRIKDAIADASTATQRFANDTASLQAGIQAFQGLAAVGTVATGVMALFGAENEDAAKAIQKVQGALAILNGVQTVANALNKDSALMLKLKEVRMIASTASTNANTAATGVNTAGTVANNGAMKVWNITKAIGKALLGDFTGLLIVGAGALATYAFATSNSNKQQKELNNETEKSKSLHQMVYDARVKNIDSIADEINKINALHNVMYSTNATYQEKINAYNQLKQIVPQYNATISQEGVVQYEAVNAIYAHIAALKDLQRAMALLEVGKELEKEQIKGELDLEEKRDKLRRKQNNAIHDRAEMARTSKQGGPTWQGGRSNEYLAAQNRYNINTAEIVKTTKEIQQQTAALKDLTNRRRAYDRLIEKEKPQNIIDAVTGKQKQTTPKAPRGGGGGGKVTPQVDKAVEEQTKYDKNKASLQQQFNDKVIDEITYRSKILELEKEHYNYLLSSGKATKEKIQNAQKLYEAAESSFKSLEIDINYNNSIANLNQQLADGLITIEQHAESVAEALKTVYLENQKIGEATKEMAEEYVKAKAYAEKLKEPLEGSVAYLEQEIQKINNILDNEVINIGARIQLETKKQELQNQLDTITQGEVTIKAKVTPTYIEKGSIDDKRASYENAISQMQQVQSDYEIGLIDKKTAKEQINKINKELKKLGLEPIHIEFETNIDKFKTDFDTTIQSFEAVDSVVDSFDNLSNAIDENQSDWKKFLAVLQIAESVMNAIIAIEKTMELVSNLLGVSKTVEAAGTIAATTASQGKVAADAEETVSATAAAVALRAQEAATLDLAAAQIFAAHAAIPFVGVPTSIGFISQMMAAMAAQHAASATLQSFAQGGIVSGGSTHGDRVLARLNAGEMVLTGHQQSNLFRAIENGDFGSSNIETPTINFKLKGSDIYGSLKNFGKGQMKTGKNIGIK